MAQFDMQEAALDAVAALSKRNGAVCSGILLHDKIEEDLVRFTKDRSPRVRLLASACLTNLACFHAGQEMEEVSLLA